MSMSSLEGEGREVGRGLLQEGGGEKEEGRYGTMVWNSLMFKHQINLSLTNSGVSVRVSEQTSKRSRTRKRRERAGACK